jgi:hypothetical protein
MFCPVASPSDDPEPVDEPLPPEPENSDMPTPTAADAAVHAAVLDEMIDALERGAAGAEEAARTAEGEGLSTFADDYRSTAAEHRRQLAALRHARALVEREAGSGRGHTEASE